jgi:hypothetical protein
MISAASSSVASGQKPSQAASTSDVLAADASPSAAPSDSAAPVTAPVLIISKESKAPSFRMRFILAGVATLFAVLAFTAIAAKPGEQPSNLVCIICALLASVVCISEAAFIWTSKRGARSVFDPVALLGLAAICAGVFTAVFSGTVGGVTPLLAAAPGLAAATVLLGRGFFILGCRVARTDAAYLYARDPHSATPIKIDQRFSLKAGDLVENDCRIASGCLALDERNLSLISTFRVREEEEMVYAGSEVLAGSAQVVALTNHEDACLTQVQALVSPMLQDAELGLEREDQKASRWSAMAIVFLASAAGIFWNERTPGHVQALLGLGSVALFASVCQVSGLVYGLRRALVRRWMARGYLLTSASSCKELAQISSVECDASRCGHDSFVQCVALDVLDDRLSETALCDFLSAILGRSEDRLLVAAGEYCRRHSNTPSVERVLEMREYQGRGICGIVHGVELSIGSEDFLVERGIMVQPSDGTGESYSANDGVEKIVLVAIDDDIVARFHITLDQSDVVPADNSSVVWNGGVNLSRSSDVARALGDNTLLIRGNESDLIGQTATRDVTIFDSQKGALRKGTVVAFTPEIAPLEQLLTECRDHTRTVDRLRLISGFGGLMVLVAAFSGLTTPVVPLLLVMFIGGMVWLAIGSSLSSSRNQC